MFITFTTTARPIAPEVKQKYASHIKNLDEALSGFDKAKIMLRMLNDMRHDDIDYGTLQYIQPHSKFHGAYMQVDPISKELCKSIDGAYFAPNDDYTYIICADDEMDCTLRWQTLIILVEATPPHRSDVKYTPLQFEI